MVYENQSDKVSIQSGLEEPGEQGPKEGNIGSARASQGNQFKSSGPHSL